LEHRVGKAEESAVEFTIEDDKDDDDGKKEDSMIGSAMEGGVESFDESSDDNQDGDESTMVPWSAFEREPADEDIEGSSAMKRATRNKSPSGLRYEHLLRISDATPRDSNNSLRRLEDVRLETPRVASSLSDFPGQQVEHLELISCL
jgi:hypothetical protein